MKRRGEERMCRVTKFEGGMGEDAGFIVVGFFFFCSCLGVGM